MSEYKNLSIEEQWKVWQEQNPVDKVPDITDEELKEALVRDLSYVSQMSVGEYILYQKHEEVKNKYPTHTVSTLFGDEQQLINLDQAKVVNEMKKNIWRPKNIEDYAFVEIEWADIEGDAGWSSTKQLKMEKLPTCVSKGYLVSQQKGVTRIFTDYIKTKDKNTFEDIGNTTLIPTSVIQSIKILH